MTIRIELTESQCEAVLRGLRSSDDHPNNDPDDAKLGATIGRAEELIAAALRDARERDNLRKQGAG